MQYSGESGRNHQFEGFLIVINEKGAICRFALTKSGSLSEFDKIFQSVNELEGISTIYSDNCCKDRKALQKSFGKDCEVKLDVFHALQRLTTSVGKREMDKLNYSKFCKDVKFIVRQDEDRSKERTMPTASKAVIVRNLDNLEETWKSYLPQLSKKRIKNLRKHAANGCISDIELSRGTFINENIHRTFNAFMKDRRKISLESFIALFTCFATLHNREVLGDPRPLLHVPMEKIFSDTYTLEGYGLVPDKGNEQTMMPEEKEINFEMEKICESIQTMEKVCSNLEVQSADKTAILTIACCPWQGTSYTMTHEQLNIHLKDFHQTYDKEAFTFGEALEFMLQCSLTQCHLNTLSKIHGIPIIDELIEDVLKKFWLGDIYSNAKELSQLVNDFGIVLVVISGCKENPVQCIPAKIVSFDKPIFIGQSGGGFHKTMTLQSSKMPRSASKNICYCGRKKKDGDKANCLSETCACVQIGVACNTKPRCRCTNCKNQNEEETFKTNVCKCKVEKCTTNYCLCVKGKKSCNELPW